MSRNIRSIIANDRFPFSLQPIYLALLSTFMTSQVWAGETAPSAKPIQVVEFDSQFLMGGGKEVDLSRFSKGNQLLPGDYLSDLYVNQGWLGRATIKLREQNTTAHDALPCFDHTLLERMQVDLSKLSTTAAARLETANQGQCVLLPELIPDATANFDKEELQLDVSIPQIALINNPSGYIDPKYWDNGIAAATLQYDANTTRSQTASGAMSSNYFGYTAGLNIGAWRLRHIATISQDQNPEDQSKTTQRDSLQTYAQRSIISLKSLLTIGDANTDGTVFDSFSLRGIQLATDDRMYPSSQLGFAPVIFGQARSNARVQIRQNGVLLREVLVAPGAFRISDLYNTASNGDLEITVIEADGSRSTWTQPYAYVNRALRPGNTRYSIAAGQYRLSSTATSPKVWQLTGQHGFTNIITGYGGILVADHYNAGSLGVALNTGIGAFSLDVTHARTSISSMTGLSKQPDLNGEKYRFSYGKFLSSIQTDVAFTGARSSSSGYLSLANAMQLYNTDPSSSIQNAADREKNSFSLSLQHQLTDSRSSLIFTGSTRDYWNRRGTDIQYQASYGSSYKKVGYTISAARQRNNDTNQWANSLTLAISIPLGLTSNAPLSLTRFQHNSSDNRSSISEDINGTLGETNALAYSLTMQHTNGNPSRNDISANASYTSPYTQLTAGLGKSDGYNQASAGISGSIVGWSGGVAFSPEQGNTTAVIEAKDAAGAPLGGGSSQRLDPWGHAAVTSLMPFQQNDIEISPEGLPLGVQLKSTSQHTAPTDGAVVKVTFPTENVGQAILLQIQRPHGESLPFGTQIFDSEGKTLGMVAQGGNTLVYGLPSQGTLRASWGGAADQQCWMHYALPTQVDKQSAFMAVNATCESRPAPASATQANSPSSAK